MKSIEVSEATGVVLDWMVCEARGCNESRLITYIGNGRKWISTEGGFTVNYTENWSQGGPIIEQEKIAVDIPAFDDKWTAYKKQPAFTPACTMRGPTVLIAAMRCYVVSKLGYNVEVPDELI
jgi:hypothetical protein